MEKQNTDRATEKTIQDETRTNERKDTKSLAKQKKTSQKKARQCETQAKKETANSNIEKDSTSFATEFILIQQLRNQTNHTELKRGNKASQPHNIFNKTSAKLQLTSNFNQRFDARRFV